MLDRHLSRSLEGATGGRPGGAGRGGPCGLRFAPWAHGAASGLNAPRAIRPASETAPAAGSTARMRPKVDRPGTRGRARTRKNAAVERREASTLRNWVRDASLGVQACRVKARQGAGDPAPSACRRSTPLVFEGIKKEAPPARF